MTNDNSSRPHVPTLTAHWILDCNGEPVRCYDLLEWADFIETGKNQINSTLIPVPDKKGEVCSINTIFFGINMSVGDVNNENPVLWETMIFGGEHHQDCIRSHTRAEALLRHKEGIKKVLRSLYNHDPAKVKELYSTFIQSL